MLHFGIRGKKTPQTTTTTTTNKQKSVSSHPTDSIFFYPTLNFHPAPEKGALSTPQKTNKQTNKKRHTYPNLFWLSTRNNFVLPNRNKMKQSLYLGYILVVWIGYSKSVKAVCGAGKLSTLMTSEIE